MLINTIQDLQSTPATAERRAFLQALYNDMVTFDDAIYPDGYDSGLNPGDDGYVAPAFRQEWNAGAAASWGFASREQVKAALDAA